VWGWMSIGARAGVDFPYLLWRMLRDEPVPRARARAGVRWVRLSTDVPTAIPEIIGGRLPWAQYLGSLRPPLELAVLALDDPVPAVIEPTALTMMAMRRARNGRG
jgi:D-aspartate ligase